MSTAPDYLFAIPTPDLARFDATRCTVKEVGFEAVKAVTAEAHYIGKPGSTSVALGIYADGTLGGVIAYGTIPRNNAEAICGPEHAPAVLELTRLALYDWMPANSESWLIGQSFAWLRLHRPDVKILVSYADQSQGHVGTIYQATNWTYTGTSTGDVVYRADNGTVLHPRTVGFGALPPGRWQSSPEKHRYVTFLGSRSQRQALRRALRWDAQPYPKETA